MPPRKRAAPRESKAKSTCKLHCCAISDERKAEIAASVHDPMTPNYGPACRCGLKKNPMTIGFGIDDGSCPRHG
jgi:hypothetical protein